MMAAETGRVIATHSAISDIGEDASMSVVFDRLLPSLSPIQSHTDNGYADNRQKYHNASRFPVHGACLLFNNVNSWNRTLSTNSFASMTTTGW
jgi:hypothetical protein